MRDRYRLSRALVRWKCRARCRPMGGEEAWPRGRRHALELAYSASRSPRQLQAECLRKTLGVENARRTHLPPRINRTRANYAHCGGGFVIVPSEEVFHARDFMCRSAPVAGNWKIESGTTCGSRMLLKWLLLWHVALISGQQFFQQETINRPVFPHHQFLPGMRQNPTHLILASKTVRPGSVFSVVVNMLEPSATTNVLASVSRDGVEIAAAETTITGMDTERLLLQIPTRSTKGQYRLRVEGQSNDILGPQFVEFQDLEFSPRFLTIVVHTSRAVYNADQIALIRVIILNMDLKPYNEPTTINILDPNDNIMASFRSVQLNVGVGTVKYTIPRYPPVGWWKIQVLTYSQVEEYKFVVEKFYNPRYEIDVTVPEFLIDTEETFSGEIGAAYLAEGQIVGNISISFYAQGPGVNDKPLLILEDFVPYFAGDHEFEYDLEEVRREMPLVAGSKLKIEAIVREHFFGISYPCWAISTVIESKVVLQFLGPDTKVFKPGMPFRIYIAASYNDLAPLPEDKLSHATVEISPTITLSTGQVQQLTPLHETVPEGGIIRVDLDIPPTAKFMVIRAKYQDEEEESQVAEIGVVSATPKETRAIYVYTTDSSADIGEYVIVHVQANFYIKDFQYLVVSKGVIVHSAKEEVAPLRNPIKTISIPVASSMAPSFEVLVYHITRDGFIFADSVSVPINKFDRQKPNLRVNPYKDKTGNTIELGVIHIPGSFYGITARDAIAFCHKCGADLTKASVLENLFGFNDEPDRISKMKWIHRGADPDQILYFDTPNTATDAPETFRLSGVVVFTDGHLIGTDSCNRSLGYLPCRDGSCYPARKRCDGQRDCASGYDEIGCAAPKIGLDMDLTTYRIFRKSRTEQFYDEEGDWGWIDFNTDDDDFFNREVPVRPSPWFVTGFAMNPLLGLSIQDEPILYDGVRPFFMTIEMPERCKSGEQVGVRVDVFNNQPTGIFVTVVLKGSDDYKFIHVEKEGFVLSYYARTSTGDHQHQTWIEPNDQIVVYMPIVFTKLGEVEVSAEVWTALAKGEDAVTVTVVPNGAKQRLHTSMMLDLKTHPYLIKYLDINVTETPIVPYQRWRRYVYGSPQGHLSLVGDVFGPVYEPDEITTDVLLDKPYHSAEALAFTFGANVWMLHYLRLTNQLTKTMLHKSFTHMRYFYGCVMNFRNLDGSFSMWERFESSVWLTAYVTNVFQQAVFSDWENVFYIDPNVISKAVEYLLKHQTPEGAFVESSRFHLNSKFDTSTKYLRHLRHQNIPLTAFVLITLGEIEDIPGEIRIKAATAKVRAMQFLEKNLHALNDPYEIAITTYALTLVNSVEQEEAFRKLDKLKFMQEGRAYWSRQERPQSDVYYDNQRPLQLPRLPVKDDALSVEASAYALLVYIAKEGLIQEHIVRWLNTMRCNDGGFISSQDTLVAMQALTEFTFRARLREITDMRITMRPSSSPELEDTLKITPDQLANLQIIEIPNVWGHVEATAKGAGYAITQLDVSYSVDRPDLLIKPPQRAFDLKLDLRFYGRNNSHINIRACQRWILQEESRQSGVAVFEMDVPTGYYQDKPRLFDYVYSRKVPNLRRMAVSDRKVYAYFDHLDGNYTCIDFNIQRWYPVANLSQYNLAKIYEYHSPERYNESIFEAYSLYVMDICQVCGSYQCPYCPYYSGGPRFMPNMLFTLMCLLITMVGSAEYFSDAILKLKTSGIGIPWKSSVILLMSKRTLVLPVLLFLAVALSVSCLRIQTANIGG